MKREELGCAGHFICAKDCHFRRHTQVTHGKRGYRISTVGNLYFADGGERQTLKAGKDYFFETLVFRLTDKPTADSEGCGCLEVQEWSEIDGQRYPTAGEAQKGHEKYVARYARKLAR
jgi:hypothetical protein